jgi:uncharacterized delta-60 repeat protein
MKNSAASLVLLAALAAPARAAFFDPSFSGDGKALVSFINLPNGGPAAAHAITTQSDLKVVVGGEVEVAPYDDRPVIVRMTTAGSLDASFGGTGFVFPWFDNWHSGRITSVTVVGGRVIAAGTACIGASSAACNVRMFVVRYTSGGQLDTTFAGNGLRLLPFDGVSSGDAQMVAIPYGKLVIAGSVTSTYLALARLDSAGNLDLSFGTAGTGTVLAAPAGSQGVDPTALIYTSQGRLLVAATLSSIGYKPGFVLGMFTTAGVRDASFGESGWVRGYSPGVDPVANDVTEDAQVTGTAIATTTTTDYVYAVTTSQRTVMLWRVPPQGAVFSPKIVRDTDTFLYPWDANLILGFGSDDIAATTIAMQGDHAVVTGGGIGTPVIAMRAGWNGLDTSLGTNGRLLTSLHSGDRDAIVTSTATSDGHVLIAGTSYDYLAVARVF